MLDFIFVYLIAYFKIHKKSQNFEKFPVLFVINDINSPLDNIAEIIDHLPVKTVLIIGLVIPLGSQQYSLFKSRLKYSFINIDN